MLSDGPITGDLFLAMPNGGGRRSRQRRRQPRRDRVRVAGVRPSPSQALDALIAALTAPV